MTRRRVVVTGIGWVTPIGIGTRRVWEGLLAGRCGIGRVRSFDTSAYSVHAGAEVHDFVASDHLRRLDPASLGRASQLAVAAARIAAGDAGFYESEFAGERCGVVMGTTSGEPGEIEGFDDRAVAGELAGLHPDFITRCPCHVIAEAVACEFGCSGVNLMIPTACSAGSYAIGYAFDLLRSDRADLMIAGGADRFSRIVFSGFARLGGMAPERCQPFDRNRQGMIPGEGAAVLVLEPLDAALARGAEIYAEMDGYGLSCDAHHMTALDPSGDGPVRAMERALRNCGLEAHEISYVSAHGTGTEVNDRVESAAFRQVFGAAADRTPISSVKSMIGHTMGAASAIEAAVCAMAVAHDRIPPTIHFEEPDPLCRVDCVPNRARELRVDVAMSNAFAFGGNNASLVFRKFLP